MDPEEYIDLEQADPEELETDGEQGLKFGGWNGRIEIGGNGPDGRRDPARNLIFLWWVLDCVEELSRDPKFIEEYKAWQKERAAKAKSG